MRYAINYSPQAAALVDDGGIDIDLFKCPAASDPVVREHRPHLIDEARALRPVYIHFPINALTAASTNWAEVDDALATTATQYVNVHLAATSAHFPNIDPASVNPGDLNSVAQAFVDAVSKVTARYGSDKVIVENVVYGGQRHKFLRAGIDPTVITRVVHETGCGLLLDLAHARLTCDTLGIDVRAYVDSLPVTSLRELHVTGTGHDEKLRDSMPMNEDDWKLLDWATSKIASGDWPEPWAVAFEYGGIGPTFDWRSDPTVIAAQFPRLTATLRK